MEEQEDIRDTNDTKLKLKVDGDLFIYMSALQLQQCGDIVQAVLEMMKPFLNADTMNELFKTSQQCYQMYRKIQDINSYRSDIIHGLRLNEASDKLWIYNQGKR